MIEWDIIAGLLCLALIIFLLWKEWSRSDRSFRTARIAAAIIAVMSLYLLAVPPSYTRVVDYDDEAMILLTEGYSDDSVKALPGYQQMPLLDMRQKDEPHLKQIHSMSGRVLHVFGYGLDEYQLSQLKAFPMVFHPCPAPEGFSQVQYKRDLSRGELLRVQGRVLRHDSADVKVILTQFGKMLDSVRAQQGVFDLGIVPAHVGRGTYSLIALADGDTLDKQRLPVYVAEQAPLNVLLLNTAPGFETRFLRDWLSRKGYKVLSRAMVSRGKYSTVALNQERTGVQRINDAALKDIDLVIADRAALSSLAQAEMAALRQAMVAEGLGLVYWADEEPGPFSIQVIKMPGAEQQKLQVQLGDTMRGLNTENQYEIRELPSLQPLVRAEGGRLLAVAKQEGRGRIVATTVNYSFKWSLAGEQFFYDRFWTSLVEKALGKNYQEKWTSPDYGMVDQPLKIEVKTDHPAPIGTIEGQKVYLAQHPLLPFSWQGSFWPRLAGWQALDRMDGQKQYFYVFPANAWKALLMSRRIQANKDFVSTSVVLQGDKVRQAGEESRQVPLIIYAILFMLSAGFLWYENKRMGG